MTAVCAWCLSTPPRHDRCEAARTWDGTTWTEVPCGCVHELLLPFGDPT